MSVDSRHTGEILLEKYPVKSGHEYKAKTSRKFCGFIFVSSHIQLQVGPAQAALHLIRASSCQERKTKLERMESREDSRGHNYPGLQR